MGQKLTLEGTKIAQAAKDLNVTTVTIRRYVAEFNINTATDENGIKVLPAKAMEELTAVRQFKEDGLSNAQVLDMLAEKRKAYAPSEAGYMETNEKTSDGDLEIKVSQLSARTNDNDDSFPENTIIESVSKSVSEIDEEDGEHTKSGEEGDGHDTDDKLDTRPKHTLTCQTCTKTFEHSNPRLRDCLDCYRAKRKERRRGGSKHKNVILHPLAQQAAGSKSASSENGFARHDNQDEMGLHAGTIEPGNGRSGALSHDAPDHRPAPVSTNSSPVVKGGNGPVRNYRKAIDETRHITSSLKRRLERPDLPEGERRWLEQVYAYQLILHQGWRHLSEYKTAVVE